MPKYAAFLRAVNLGTERRAGSAQLVSAFEGLGFEGVATFRTSGNVVFEGRREGARKLERRIDAGLAKALGFEVTVFVRTASEVAALAKRDPFPRAAVESSKGKLQVALLHSKPAAAARREILALATDEDRLNFGDRELYWLPSGGTQDSRLDMKTIDSLLRPMTMRTKGTIEQLAAKFFDA
jgi:uncharacterized protein (DUF1697 family)